MNTECFPMSIFYSIFPTAKISMEELSREREAQIPLIIEFIGLPGAGKTTVSYKVATKLNSNGIRVISRSKILSQWRRRNNLVKIVRLFPSSIDYWLVLAHAIVISFQVKPVNWWSISQAIKVFSNLKRNDDVAQSKKYQVILLDQGSIQEVWSVLLSGELSQAKFLEKTVSLISNQRRIALVYFKVDMETALDRIQSRPKKSNCPFDLMEAEKAYSSLLKYSPYLQEIVQQARTSGVPVLEIDSSSLIDQQVDKIDHWIAQQLGHQAALTQIH